MEDRIRDTIKEMFRGLPMTEQTLDMRDEIIQNSLDKYTEMVSNGRSAEDAYQVVIHGVGDIHELFDEEETKAVPEDVNRKKRAFWTTFAIILFIMIPVATVGIDMIGLNEDWIPIVVMLLVAGGTGILVYMGMMFPEKKEDKEDTINRRFYGLAQ